MHSLFFQPTTYDSEEDSFLDDEMSNDDSNADDASVKSSSDSDDEVKALDEDEVYKPRSSRSRTQATRGFVNLETCY